MDDSKKTKAQLITELEGLRKQCNDKRIAEMDKSGDMLEEAEARFRLLYEDAPLAYQSLDIDGNIIEANKSWLEALGYKHEEVIGKWFGDFLAPEYVAHFKKNFPRFKEQGETHEVEFEFVKKDGSQILVSFDGKIGHNPDGTFRQTHCVWKDITERRKADEALRANEILLKTILQTALDGYWLVNMQRQLLEVNDAYCQMSGYSKQELLTMSIPDLEVLETHEVAATRIQKLITDGELRFESKHRCKDGKVIDVEVSIQYLPAEELMVAFLRDITERKRAEEALRESEDFLNRTGDIAKVGGWEIDFETGKVLWTRTTGRIHELPDGFYPDLENAINYYHPDDREIVRESINRAIEDGEPFTFDTRLITAKGHERWVRAIGQPIHKAGKCVRLSGTFQDITEHRKAEEAIKLSEKRLRQIIDLVPHTIFSRNLDGRFILANKASAEFFSTTVEKLEGSLLSDYHFTDEEIRNILAVDKEINDKGEVWTNHNRILTNTTGEIRYHSTIKIPFTFSESENPSILGIGTDITDRKKAVEALRDSEAKYRTLFERESDAIFIYDPETFSILDVNDATSKMYGYDKDELLGMSCLKFSAEVERSVSVIDKIREDGEVKVPSALHRKKDGTIFPIEISGYKIAIGGKEVMFAVSKDITERKQLEEQLRIRERMDSVGTLASGIAHDFNNLLAGIMGNLDLLKIENDNFSKYQRDYLDESYQLCQKSASLIKNFQTLSSDSVYEISSVDVYDVASEVISLLMRTTDRLIEKHIDIEIEKYFVLGVYDQLHQVFLNLGTNAIQSIEEKGVQPEDYIRISACDCEPEIAIKRELPQGSFVHITFEDTGNGMTEDVKRQAFEPLFTTKERGVQKGQGLGLAMVYNIITRHHNGYIDIETEEGKGTKFHIFLPKAEAKNLSVLSETPVIIGGTETILIIEDEESIRRLGERALTKFGYTTLVASDGASGLDLYKEKHDSIDLVILDLTLPKMSGEMVLDGIMTVNPDAKVVISSGQSQIEQEKHKQAKGFVAKPYKLDDLTKAVRDALDE